MRAMYFRESFEGNSRKFSKFENENEGDIFESFGIPIAKLARAQKLDLFLNVSLIKICTLQLQILLCREVNDSLFYSVYHQRWCKILKSGVQKI